MITNDKDSNWADIIEQENQKIMDRIVKHHRINIELSYERHKNNKSLVSSVHNLSPKQIKDAESGE